MSELKTQTIADIDILRAGAGFHGKGCPDEGCEFTAEMIDEVIGAYWATKGARQPPVKIGHNEEQPLLDGLPATGWVANLRRRGDRMYADLLDVPQQVADLVQAGAYRAVSVELEPLEVDGMEYPLALTALALLGADLPAVDSLTGIAKLYQSLKLELKDDTQLVVVQMEQEEETLETFMEEFDAYISRAERHFKGRVGAPVLRSLQRAFKEGLKRAATKRTFAEWDTAYINDLPDSAFAYVAMGGEKDEEGKTVPRSLRYLPHHGSGGAVDLPHLRNALARAPQTNLPGPGREQAIRHLQGHARSEGVGEYSGLATIATRR